MVLISALTKSSALPSSINVSLIINFPPDTCRACHQAQARCHRIGQSKAVKVYRLVTRNSYEREMFDRASMKLGLDKAVLQRMGGKEMNQVRLIGACVLLYVRKHLE